MKTRCQAFAFKWVNLYRYHVAAPAAAGQVQQPRAVPAVPDRGVGGVSQTQSTRLSCFQSFTSRLDEAIEGAWFQPLNL
jgi:hypothetical protein